MHLERHLAVPLRRAAQNLVPVLVQGPRGSGKTTLLRREFPGHLYVALDDAADRARARRDPAAFLGRIRGPAVIDDLQRAPELIRHLESSPLQLPLVLASSVRIPLGVATFELYRPTRAECHRRPPLPLEVLGRFAPAASARPGGPAGETVVWDCRRGFADQDLRGLVNVRELDRFEEFVRLAEARSGEVLDQQALAREAGVAHRTVVRWLAALAACFLTLRLEPSDRAFGRRIVRRSKLHFLEHSSSFESEVVSEIYRNVRHAGLSPGFSYWRDSNGFEIPLIVDGEPGGPPMPVGIAAVPNPAHEARLRRWMELAGVSQAAMIAKSPGLPGRRQGGVVRYAVWQL